MKEDFNPLPPHGGRRPPICNIFSDPVFQSTPSTRRETYWISVTLLESFSFQSTPSTRRETPSHLLAVLCDDFNPLPPHGGRPTAQPQHFFRSSISIHSLHTEGDNIIYNNNVILNLFQSTPSTRRETRITGA